jgi:hypothetical protein
VWTGSAWVPSNIVNSIQNGNGITVSANTGSGITINAALTSVQQALAADTPIPTGTNVTPCQIVVIAGGTYAVKTYVTVENTDNTAWTVSINVGDGTNVASNHGTSTTILPGGYGVLSADWTWTVLSGATTLTLSVTTNATTSNLVIVKATPAIYGAGTVIATNLSAVRIA